MFQTEIHIAVQSFSSDFLTWLMLQVTATGYYTFIAVVVIAIMFGFSLRKGFLLFQVIAWTAVFSETFKNLFALPRPFFVDSRVHCFESRWDTTTVFRQMGGKNFFDLPGQQAIDAFRLKGMSFGFPSGHASGAVALWGGLALVFRKRMLVWLAPFMVALTAFTRIYLGVHFLADVLGGVLLGAGVLYGARRLIGGDDRRGRFFAVAGSALHRSLPGILYAFFLFIAPLLLGIFSLLTPKIVGFCIGLNAAFTLSLRSGLPSDKGSVWVRLCRVALGGFLFLSSNLVLHQAISLFPSASGTPWGKFLTAFGVAFLAFWGGLRLFLHMGLYCRE